MLGLGARLIFRGLLVDHGHKGRVKERVLSVRWHRRVLARTCHHVTLVRFARRAQLLIIVFGCGQGVLNVSKLLLACLLRVQFDVLILTSLRRRLLIVLLRS